MGSVKVGDVVRGWFGVLVVVAIKDGVVTYADAKDCSGRLGRMGEWWRETLR